MADKKISALTAASTPLAGTEVLPIVQSSATVKVSVANLTAGRSVSATAYSATSGGFTSSSGGVHRSDSAAESNSISNLFYAQNAAGTKALNWQLSSTNVGSVWAYNGSSWIEVWAADTSGNLRVPTQNIVVGTAAKGVTTGGSFDLGLGANGSTSAVYVNTSNKLLINTTSNAFSGYALIRQTVSADDTLSLWNSATTGDNVLITFFTDGGSGRGSITYNRGLGQIAYNITSDYRAKDIIGPVQNPGVVIDALKVYTAKMKGATVEAPMLIAHEAQAVVPYCVTGDKDAVNADGSPKYQQMDVSSLVPLLLAEIQMLRVRVSNLEQR